MTAPPVSPPRRRSAPALRRLCVVALLCGGLGGVACAQRPPRRPDPVTRSPAWKHVDKLVDEQKLEEAARAVAEIRGAARHSGDEAEVTRALVKEVQACSLPRPSVPAW